jgi:hypothetical protein
LRRIAVRANSRRDIFSITMRSSSPSVVDACGVTSVPPPAERALPTANTMNSHSST